MIHKQAVWLTLGVLLVAVLVLVWVANHPPPCPGGGQYDLRRGRCLNVRY
jgi:hypothetical protein